MNHGQIDGLYITVKFNEVQEEEEQKEKEKKKQPEK